MPNLTLAITEELHEKMKKHSEIKWSEVARRTIEQKVTDLELLDRIAHKSRLTKKDAKDIASIISKDALRELEKP